MTKDFITCLSAEGKHFYVYAHEPTGTELDTITHMRVYKYEPRIPIPKNLEYLFIQDQTDGVWPSVKNMFIEVCTVENYLKHNSPDVFNVFCVGRGPVSDQFTVDGYTLSPNKTIDAFGVTWHYREAIKNKPGYAFPDEEVVTVSPDKPMKHHITLRGLSDRTLHLNLRNVTMPSFKAADLKCVSHLMLNRVTDQMDIPESLDYLFIYNQKSGTWPTVKHLFIEQLDVKNFLELNTPDVFYVFQWGGMHVDSVKKLCSYNLKPEKEITAFGYTYCYRKAVRKVVMKPVQPSTPDQGNLTYPEPTARLTVSELIELSTSIMTTEAKGYADQIYDEAYDHCKRGMHREFEKVLTFCSVQRARDFVELLAIELPGYIIKAHEGTDLTVRLTEE